MSDISSDESNSSDNEFWQTLDKTNPKIKPSVAINQSELPASSKLLISEKERLIKTILNIRDSKEVELQTQEIKLINSSKKELVKRINELKEEFITEYIKLKTEYADSISIIVQKDQKISELTSALVAQENIITSQRISLNLPKNPKKVQSKSNISANEVSALRDQIFFYKETIEEFKKEIASYQLIFKNLNEEIAKLKRSSNTKQETQSVNIMFDKANQDYIELKKEFEKYKFEAEKEVELREIINNRYLDSISVLQEELKISNSANKSPKNLNLKRAERIAPAEAIKEEVSTQIKLDKPQAKSLPRYPCNIQNKIPSNYSFKEYKAFHPESTQNIQTHTPTRSTPKPRLDILPSRNILFPSSNESRQKFFKSSVFYVNKY